MSISNKLANTPSAEDVDVAMKKAAELEKPQKRAASSAKVEDIHFSAVDGKENVQPLDRIEAQGEKLGEGIVYRNANRFNESVANGAKEAMKVSQAATEALIQEVDTASSDYFQGIAARLGL